MADADRNNSETSPDSRAHQPYALISVSDKHQIETFARQLSQLGFRLLSTGGTAKTLQHAGLPVTEVADITRFPEIMGGRVKTLHPKIHGGLLGRRGIDDEVMAAHHIPDIRLLVLNLYPFETAVAQPECTLEQAVENIDIGGPAMLRAAAKNFAHVAVVTDPRQYQMVIDQLRSGDGRLSDRQRFELAVAAFNHVARYDDAISDYLSSVDPDGGIQEFPAQANGCFVKRADLRYGENPHQAAAFYADLYPAPGALVNFVQHQGKSLSFNNIADADAAWECVCQFDAPACVIVKHANPCGAAAAADIRQAYERAFSTDPTSAFGGIIAFNQQVNLATAEAVIDRQFVEVVIAPGYQHDALDAFGSKQNVRLLEVAPGDGFTHRDVRRISSGLLIQTADNVQVSAEMCEVVTDRVPDQAEWQDLLFAWKVAKYVKSNAIVYAGDARTLGIGAGQMSRVDSARIARWKAADADMALQNAVMASDAFFPFRDGIDTAAEVGIKAVIQPGGSMRDAEVIAAANEHGIAMVFTGIRHFRH